jgi:hypothetical protein
MHHYTDADIMFLQEVSTALAGTTTDTLGAFDVHLPGDMDPSRDQNSLILTRGGKFKNHTVCKRTREGEKV